MKGGVGGKSAADVRLKKETEHEGSGLYVAEGSVLSEASRAPLVNRTRVTTEGGGVGRDAATVVRLAVGVSVAGTVRFRAGALGAVGRATVRAFLTGVFVGRVSSSAFRFLAALASSCSSIASGVDGGDGRRTLAAAGGTDVFPCGAVTLRAFAIDTDLRAHLLVWWTSRSPGT